MSKYKFCLTYHIISLCYYHDMTPLDPTVYEMTDFVLRQLKFHSFFGFKCKQNSISHGDGCHKIDRKKEICMFTHKKILTDW